MQPEHDHNPYAPPIDPGYHEEPPPSDDRRPAFELATLGSRFGGALIDGVVNLVLVYGFRLLYGVTIDGAAPSFADLFGAGALRMGVPSLLSALLPLGVMGALIAQRSQSIGKIMMGTRIVLPDGRPAGLLHGFVLRTLPLTAIAYVPSVLIALGMPLLAVQPFTLITSLVSFLDAVLIFGAERRCLHDRIGGTSVAVAGTERSARSDGERPRKKKKRRKPASDA